MYPTCMSLARATSVALAIAVSAMAGSAQASPQRSCEKTVLPAVNLPVAPQIRYSPDRPDTPIFTPAVAPKSYWC
jgi:hypothetical protein